jgi:hypothetical protein
VIDPELLAAVQEAAWNEWKRREIHQITASPREHLDAIVEAGLAVVEAADD